MRFVGAVVASEDLVFDSVGNAVGWFVHSNGKDGPVAGQIGMPE